VRKIKFGVFLPFYAFQTQNPTAHYQQLLDLVLECERLNYDSIWLDDHLMYDHWPILESWTTLSALAAKTNRIRLGTMVSCISHRNPTLIAKSAATLDTISNGRLDLGIGAGAQEKEHTAYGFGFPKLSERVEILGEALDVITQLWRKDKTSYQSKYYTLKDAVCEPKPLQKPNPPIIIGGNGEKILKVTARYADRFDWGNLSIESYQNKLGILEKNCEEIGRDFSKIEKSCWPAGQVLIAENQKELSAKVKEAKPNGMTLTAFNKSTLVGAPEEFIEPLHAYLDLGVTYFMLYFADLPKVDSLKLFAEKILKSL
jgi:F420-dependent oxidoreductase-like protein